MSSYPHLFSPSFPSFPFPSRHSGRLIILPKKSWHVWNQDNREKVLRDERLHREEQDERAEQQRYVRVRQGRWEGEGRGFCTSKPAKTRERPFCGICPQISTFPLSSAIITNILLRPLMLGLWTANTGWTCCGDGSGCGKKGSTRKMMHQ